MPEQPVTVNLAHLRAIVGDNPAQLRQLLPVFLTNIAELADKLEDAALFEDEDAWRHTAHRMRGVAANFGFTHLQQLCSRAEDTTPAPMATLLAPIRQSVQQASHAVQQTIAAL